MKAAAAAEGLWYPPDPSSFEICSIGGNAATNAGGLCCVKYGVTVDYVLALEVVLADGRAIRLGGKLLKDSAGLPLTKLFVGSEGLLGIITEVTVRLPPAQPRPARSWAPSPASVTPAGRSLAITGRIRPAMLEFMDAVSINAVEDMLHMDLDRSAGALLVAQSDAPGEAGAAEIAIIEQAFRDNGAGDVFSTDDPDEGDVHRGPPRRDPRRRTARIAAPGGRGRAPASATDAGRGVAAIAAQRDVVISVIAHAGDGNTHPLIVFDPADSDQTERAHLAFGEVMELAISLGGTITGEHGVGRLRRATSPPSR